LRHPSIASSASLALKTSSFGVASRSRLCAFKADPPEIASLVTLYRGKSSR
jgi:hypothetical protein